MYFVCGNAYVFDARAVKKTSEGRMKTPFCFETRQLCCNQEFGPAGESFEGGGRRWTAQVFVRYVGESPYNSSRTNRNVISRIGKLYL